MKSIFPLAMITAMNNFADMDSVSMKKSSYTKTKLTKKQQKVRAKKKFTKNWKK